MITKYFLTMTVILSLSLCGCYTVTPSSKSSSISGKDCKVSFVCGFILHQIYLNLFFYLSGNSDFAQNTHRLLHAWHMHGCEKKQKRCSKYVTCLILLWERAIRRIWKKFHFHLQCVISSFLVCCYFSHSIRGGCSMLCIHMCTIDSCHKIKFTHL